MAKQEGTSAGVFKQNVEDMALDELQRLRIRRETVASELKEIDVSIRAVRSVLGAVTPKPEKPAKKKRGPIQKPAEATMERAREFIADNESELTVSSIAKALGVGDSYGNMIAKQLREEGLLRLAATQGSLHVYRSTVSS